MRKSRRAIKFGARALVKTDALKTKRLGRNHNVVFNFFNRYLLFLYK